MRLRKRLDLLAHRNESNIEKPTQEKGDINGDAALCQAIKLSQMTKGFFKNETEEQRLERMAKLRLKRLEKSPYRELPHSHQRSLQYKTMVNKIYGECCFICERKIRLELHHLWYENDSVNPKIKTGKSHLMRLIEAIQHPERFIRLCRRCHYMITILETRKDKIDRIFQILKASEQKIKVIDYIKY